MLATGSVKLNTESEVLLNKVPRNFWVSPRITISSRLSVAVATLRMFLNSNAAVIDTQILQHRFNNADDD